VPPNPATVEKPQGWKASLALHLSAGLCRCGKPVIKGTRLAAEFIVDLLAQGWTAADVLERYPGVSQEDILACRAYASAVLHAEKVYPLAVR
jgi:uncharacterized protein (DUF433 family)